MQGSLDTTNVWLGIMAVTSLLEALLLIAVGIAGYRAYTRVLQLVEGLEARQVAPAMGRVNAILDDVKRVTETVKTDTMCVDHAIRSTIDRVDDTADRVRSNVRTQTSRIIGLVRGARMAIETILQSRAA